MVQESYTYKNNPNLLESMNKFLADLNRRNKSQNTIEDYERILLQFLSFIKKKHPRRFNDKDDLTLLKAIKIEDLDEYIEASYNGEFSQNNKQNSPSTLNKKISTLLSYYTYLVKKRIVSVNIASALEFSKIAKENPEYLTLEEVNSILDTIKECGINNKKFTNRDYCIVVLLSHCGLRLSELINIDINEIDFENKTILVKGGKGQKDRTVYMLPLCIESINNYLETDRQEFVNRLRNEKYRDTLLLTQQGTKISTTTIQSMVKEYAIKAKVNKNVHPHIFRHAYATLLHQAGMDIVELQELLGHDEISTTKRYISIDNQKLKNKVNQINPFAGI